MQGGPHLEKLVQLHHFHLLDVHAAKAVNELLEAGQVLVAPGPAQMQPSAAEKLRLWNPSSAYV